MNAKAKELELCEPRYKLPEWKRGEYDNFTSSVDVQFFTLEYVIDEYDECVKLFLNRLAGDTEISHKIGEYPAIDEAKEAAEKHYNELVSELIKQLTSAHLTDEAKNVTAVSAARKLN